MLRYGSSRIRKHRTMRMRRKMKRRMTRAKVVFCSRDMTVTAESDDEEEEDNEAEERATKCPPEEYSREERAEVKGSPSIFQDHRSATGVGQWLCSLQRRRYWGILVTETRPGPLRWTTLSVKRRQTKTQLFIELSKGIFIQVKTF